MYTTWNCAHYIYIYICISWVLIVSVNSLWLAYKKPCTNMLNGLMPLGLSKKNAQHLPLHSQRLHGSGASILDKIFAVLPVDKLQCHSQLMMS